MHQQCQSQLTFPLGHGHSPCGAILVKTTMLHGSNMRIASIYFAKPAYFNTPGAFLTADGPWWAERQVVSLYLGKTATTNILRFRSIYFSYLNDESESDKYKAVYLNRNQGATTETWHLVSFISNGTSLIIAIDELAPVTAEAFPSVVLDYKAFARLNILSHYDSTNFPHYIPRGPVRLFDYALTREQHTYIYQNDVF